MNLFRNKPGQSIEDWVGKYYLFIIGVILAVCFYNFFYHLASGQVWDWDEAHYGINAYEMVKNHEFGICTYYDRVDHSNLKPPLAPWLIVAGYKLFGFNTFGLRFYSAVSCLFLVLISTWFVTSRAGKVQGILSGFILATTAPFIFNHGARSGDFCSIFTLFLLLFMICVYKAEENGRFLVLAGLCLAGGFLSYSYHCIQMVVIMVLYLALTGIYRRIAARYYAGFFLCAFLPAVAWAVWRGSYPDGMEFLKYTFYFDVLIRSSREIEGHTGGIDYYLNAIGTQNLFWTIYLGAVLFAFFAAVPVKWSAKNRFILLISLGFLVPFTLFSLAKSKLSWYVDPLYPSFAMVAGSDHMASFEGTELPESR